MAVTYPKSTDRKSLPRGPTALRPRLYVRPASGSRPHLKLPCVLPRPVIREVSMSSIRASYPELEGVDEDYVRRYLPSTSEQLLSALAGVKPVTPETSGRLPKEIEIIVNDAAIVDCPTHMLAVYSPNQTPGEGCRMILHPTHHVVLSLNCSSLPPLQSSPPIITANSTTTIPVLPLKLPFPALFAPIHQYLYTKDARALRTFLLPPNHRSFNIVQLTRQGIIAVGIWTNACALGIVDEQLYVTIENALEQLGKAAARLGQPRRIPSA